MSFSSPLWTPVVNPNAAGNPHTTIAVTGGAVSTNDILVLALNAFNAGTITITCADNTGAGNVWTQLQTVASPGLRLFVAKARGSAASITVTATAASSLFMGVILAAFPGSSASVVDGGFSITGSGTTLTGTPMPLLGTGDLVLAVGGTAANGITWSLPGGSGMTIGAQIPGTANQANGLVLAYQVGVTGTAATGLVMSPSSTWGMMGAAYGDTFLPGITPTPATIAAGSTVLGAIEVDLTAFQQVVPWDGTTTFTASGVAGVSISSYTVTSSNTAKLFLLTGSATGTLTIVDNNGVPALVTVVNQPIRITPQIAYSGQVLHFRLENPTPAANGGYALSALTAVTGVPTVNVNGSAVTPGAATWGSTTHTRAFVDFLLPSVLAPTDVVTVSWPSGFLATALGSFLQAGVSVGNSAGRIEPQYTVTPTMKVGVNVGSQPSVNYGNNYPLANQLRHGLEWAGVSGTVISGFDADKFPISWTPGGTVSQKFIGSTLINQVDGQLVPMPFGIYTAQYDDFQVTTSNKLVLSLITGFGNVTISAPMISVSGTVVTVAWNVQYVANPATLRMDLSLQVTSPVGLWANPVPPDLWVFAPGDTIDRSRTLRTGAVALSRWVAPNGRAIANVRDMDLKEGYGGQGAGVYDGDQIFEGAAYYGYSATTTTAAQPYAYVRHLNTDPAKGPGGDNTYGWVSTRVYGDQDYFVGGTDVNGKYLPLAATDNGAFLFPSLAGANGKAVFEIRWPNPHGLRHGYTGFVKGSLIGITGVADNGSGAYRVTLATAAYWTTGATVWVNSPTGVPNVRGFWKVTQISPTVYDLQGSTFSGAYVSGGDMQIAIPLAGPTFAITGAADNGSGLVRITCPASPATGFVTGSVVTISGVVGVPANGRWTLTRITSTTFDLVGSTFSGAYVSGGSVYNNQAVRQNNISFPFWVTGPNTVATCMNFDGFGLATGTLPYVVEGAAEIQTTWFLQFSVPLNAGCTPQGYGAALAAQLGAAYHCCVPIDATAGYYQAIAREVAAETPYGRVVNGELSNEIWNVETTIMRSLGVVQSYLPPGTPIWNGHYTTTGAALPNSYASPQVLASAAAFDVIQAEWAAIGRADIVFKRGIGSQFSNTTLSGNLLSFAAQQGIHFDYLYVATYTSISTDAPFVTAAGSWPVPALWDLCVHEFSCSTGNEAAWAGHAAAIAANSPTTQLACYEGFPQGVVPVNNGALLHDMYAHPSAYAGFWRWLAWNQIGDPATANSGAVFCNVYQGWTTQGTYSGGNFQLYCGIYQPPGYGLSNLFATSQGGAPADGKSHYGPAWSGGVMTSPGNQSPAAQAVLDWAATTSPATQGGPIDVVSDAGTLIVADDPEPSDEVDAAAGTLIIL